MTPILYEKDEIDFTSQGLGSLVEIYDVDVEEQRNGLLQLTASYPVSGLRYADISVGRIILAKPNQRDDVHAFRIVSTELDISGYSVAIEADSITYDLTHNLVKHLNVSGNGQVFMTALKNAIVNPSILNFYSDINHASSTSLDYVNPMEAIMGVKGSFLQIWGGELKRENRRVAMFNRRGRDNVATFRLGKNIAGLKYSVDISSLVTRIIPTKSVQNDDQTTTTLEGTPVDSQYINNYEQIYTLPLEFTDDTIKTVADLNAAAKGWFTKSANTGRDKPTVTIDIDVLSLQDSADYQDKFKNLESVSLTDTVTVYVPEYGVNVTAIVNELHYDPILDRVTKMTVGTAKQSFADSSRTQLSDLQDKIISVQNQADAVAVSANGKSTNYYGSVEPSHPQEADTWFWVNGDKSGIKVFVNGEWVDQVDSDTQEKIAAAVNDAVSQAKSHTDEVKQGLSSDIATAKSQAASLASTAEANAKSEATSLFNQAQNALSDAKTDLTKSISSEASKAVAAANSQAQNYVNQAKSDINDTINALSVGGRNLYITATQVAGYINGTNGTLDPQNSATKEVVSDYIAVLPNTAYTFQAWGSLLSGQQYWAGIGQYGSDKSFLNRLAGIYSASTVTTDVPNDYEKTTFTTSANTYFVRVSSRTFGNYRVKFEQGNMPTDWSTAPEDVVYDYTDKDNKIKQTFTQYQETNDRLVSKSQTDATMALGLVETKISKTEYDRKTGELSRTINEAKDTADKSLKTIADIKEADGKRDSRISEVEKTAGEVKQTVSDLTTAQDKQSGYISTLQQKAQGFDATVTKVNNLAVGGRNLLLGTRDWTDNTRWNQENTVTKDVYRGMVIASSGSAWASPVYMMQNAGILQVGKTYTFSTYVRNTSDTNTKVAPYYDGGIVAPIGTTTSLPAHTDWMRVSITFQCVKDPTTSTSGLRWEGQNALTNGQIQFAGYKLEEGNLPTDWTPAPEDVDSATAKVKLTADEASAAVTKLTSADGVITKVQADIKLNADAINEKVSKTVYDQKTGELSRTINEAKDTADRSLKTIGDYKTSNDERVKAAESSIERTAKAITEKVSQTDYDDYKSKLNTRFTKVEATADGASTTVGKLSTAVNNLGQINRLLNTEFNPDYAAWTTYDSGTRLGVDNRWLHNGSNNLSVNRDQDLSNWGFAFQNVAIGQNTTFSFSVNVKINSMMSSKGRLYIHLRALDANGNVISDIYKSADKSTTINFEKFSMQNAQTPAGTTAVELAMGMYGGGSVSFNQPFFVLDSHIGSYVAGNYSNSDYLAQVKITAENISNFVRDPSGNLSSSFQTALSKTSIIIGSTLASSIQTQTSSQISSALRDNNGKIISLINQDTSGVQISGKNITLDGDTKVTGDFYAKGGNFTNLDASKIKVGTLNGDLINITNINVQSLVGDISSFIQSNWDGEYGSTKITSAGMTINTQYIQADFQGFGMDFSYSNKKIGGMGISQYLNGEPGLSMRLESDGAYMSWSARNEGNSTGPYIDKLAWYRQGKPALGGNYGFIFSDRVTFNKPINIEGTSINLGFRPINLYGNLFPFFGNQDNMTGFAYTSNEIYMVLQNQYVNLSKVIKALSGLGAWSVPTNIDSTGKVTQWFNVTT